MIAVCLHACTPSECTHALCKMLGAEAVPDLAHDLAPAICLLVIEGHISRQIAKTTDGKEATLQAAKNFKQLAFMHRLSSLTFVSSASFCFQVCSHELCCVCTAGCIVPQTTFHYNPMTSVLFAPHNKRTVILGRADHVCAAAVHDSASDLNKCLQEFAHAGHQLTDLRLPFDDVEGPIAQVKHRLALGIKQHLLGWHVACHHNEEGTVW